MATDSAKKRVEPVDSCNLMIILMSLITLVFGILTAYYYHSGDKTTMFYPLIIGFVFIFIDFYFIDKRATIITGKKSETPLK